MNALGDLLDGIAAFYERYIVFQSRAQVTAITLWDAHTHALEAFDVTPYIAITSPEMRSGKSRVQEVSERLVARPLKTSNASVAAIFRVVEEEEPTLLLDEVDAIFKSKGDGIEELRGLLNDGYRRGGTALRCVGTSKDKVKKFKVFCPKMFAAIGELPGTIADRSIPIRLQRKARSETVEKFRFRDVEPEGEDLRQALAEILKPRTDELRRWLPTVPDLGNDRAEEVWEPLLAIAELAGDGWTKRARAAAIELHADASDESLGTLLLSHIQESFNGTDKLSTESLLRMLIDRDDGPWAHWWEREVEDGRTRGPAARLARLLKPFGIETHRKVWIDDRSVRGYTRESFEEVWKRYVGSERLDQSENESADEFENSAEGPHSFSSEKKREGRNAAPQGMFWSPLANSWDSPGTASDQDSSFLPLRIAERRKPAVSEQRNIEWGPRVNCAVCAERQTFARVNSRPVCPKCLAGGAA